MRRRTIIVFARAPRFGTVKTRLARAIGPLAALAFYRRSLAATLAEAARVRGADLLLAAEPVRFAWPAGLRVTGQGTGDLGRRMARALASVRDSDAVLVGADIPGLTARHLEHAVAQLRHHHAVFGPAEDGGFWLVGLRAGFRPRGLFRTVRWSGPHALADSIMTLPRHARTGRAATLHDVDDLDDYRRAQNNTKRTAGRRMRLHASGGRGS
ncbi:MAG: TIGR04282 family arsenosugar biosynthesis glycosyltransferase [Pseudomonadota bacterium]|nr:TIGR04282 family arsenosugar biosynthesis glycosyltransferase [Pseudomonadota bacterium]